MLSRSITQAGEADLYTFSGTVGDIITMTIVETTDWGGSFGANDAQLTLFSPADAQLAALDSDGQVDYTLPTTGTYLIRVTANNLVSTGSYDVGLQCL